MSSSPSVSDLLIPSTSSQPVPLSTNTITNMNSNSNASNNTIQPLLDDLNKKLSSAKLELKEAEEKLKEAKDELQSNPNNPNFITAVEECQIRVNLCSKDRNKYHGKIQSIESQLEFPGMPPLSFTSDIKILIDKVENVSSTLSSVKQQQSIMNQQQSIMNQKQSIMNQQQSIMKQQQSTMNQQQSIMSQKQSTMSQQQSIMIRPLQYLTMRLMDGWEDIHSSKPASEDVRPAEESKELKQTSTIYYGITNKFCQVLGPQTPHVVSAHIWPKSKHHELPLFHLLSSDINNPRNLLRLHRDIEHAFDQKRLTFVPVSSSNFSKFQVKLMSTDEKWLDTEIKDTALSFRQLENKPLLMGENCAPNHLPFRRILSFHVQMSFRAAERNGWIPSRDLTEMQIWANEMARYSLGELSSLSDLIGGVGNGGSS